MFYLLVPDLRRLRSKSSIPTGFKMHAHKRASGASGVLFFSCYMLLADVHLRNVSVAQALRPIEV